MSVNTPVRPKSINEVPGWFPALDQGLFNWFLERQTTPGDLLELGCYLGKSAVLMGRHLREEETFTVCDLFEGPAPDEANQEEMHQSYASLTRAAFESNYLAFHESLPEIVHAPTSVILDHVQPASCRFVHVDASHLYEHVRGDLAAARTALTPAGLIACDDYRSEHTPGVAAAVWEAVATGDLRPICVSTQKLYATWGDPAPIQDELLEWLEGWDGCKVETQQVAGRRLIRTNRGNWAQARLAAGDSQIKALNDEVKLLKRSLKRKTRQLEAVRTSASFRAGRAVTAPFRAVRPKPGDSA